MADRIWDKLAGVFSKEVLHCQHVLTFCLILTGKAGSYSKRQLVNALSCTIQGPALAFG